MNLRILLVPALCLALAAACGGGDDGDGDGGDSESNAFGLTSELVTPAANADAIDFAPDGRLFLAEHWTGAIRVVSADGQAEPEPWATVPDLAANLYWGLTGLAIDPEFETNGYVYAFYTQLVAEGPPPTGRPTVIRFTEEGGKGADPQIIIDDLPEQDGASPINANGSIHFGPDGFLYLTLSDYNRRLEIGPSGQQLPLDLGSTIGKTLRVNKEDGSAPPDNPYIAQEGADPRIFAIGFRNAYNFAFHPDTGSLYGSDNGGRTCEEINIVEGGADYGWPRTEQTPFDCAATPQQPPIHLLSFEGTEPNELDSVVGVTGIEAISADVYPTLGESLVICESRSQVMRRLLLEPPGFDRVTASDIIERDCGEVAKSEEGHIYYATVYEIRRLVPPPETASPSPE